MTFPYLAKGGGHAAPRYQPIVEALEDRIALHGVPTPTGTYAFHIHVNLTIVLNGQAQTIPANIGIGPGGIAKPVHTHDATGLIHIESPVQRPVLLQEFFTNWGMPFSSQQVLSYRADPAHPITMLVNGQSNSDFGSLLLHDGDNIVIVANGPGTGSAPEPSPAHLHFVREIFHDLLDRDIDGAGLAFLAGQLTVGALGRTQLVLAVLASAEYQAHVVDDLYHDLLLRAPDPAGKAFFVTFLQSGGTQDQVAAFLAASDEYWQVHGGTNGGFFQALYHDALGRSPDADGLRFFWELLDDGAPRGLIAAAFFASDEHRGFLVKALYRHLLHRGPDQDGLGFFVAAVKAGADHEQIVAALLASNEYQQHAEEL